MKRLVTFVLAFCLPLAAFAGDHAAIEKEVRAAAEDFNDAYEANDIERYFSYYANGAVLYWSGQRQEVGNYYDEWRALIEAGGGVEKNEMTDAVFQVLAEGETVVASYFIHNVTRWPDGTRSEADYYESDVWQKIDGKWKVVHLHYSEL
jgi:ketosteroid isomerase-like protein